MAGSTRDAYGSLQRLTEDTEKNLRELRNLTAAATGVWVMDTLTPYFERAMDDFRAAAKELRADLDLLTDPGSEQ